MHGQQNIKYTSINGTNAQFVLSTDILNPPHVMLYYHLAMDALGWVNDYQQTVSNVQRHFVYFRYNRLHVGQ
jgi:hypothetical protein